MKHLLWLLLATSLVVRAAAQSNAPVKLVRLAIIPESEEVASLGSILNFNLSQNSSVAMLERSEVEKVYREQSLSAENRNFVKLGQVLGADGLCLLGVARTATETNLSLRVVAVKPAVVCQPLPNHQRTGASKLSYE